MIKDLSKEFNRKFEKVFSIQIYTEDFKNDYIRQKKRIQIKINKENKVNGKFNESTLEDKYIINSGEIDIKLDLEKSVHRRLEINLEEMYYVIHREGIK